MRALGETTHRTLLDAHPDVTNLTKKRRAALGLLEKADAALAGICERAPLVAEQLALDQRLGDGKTALADERRGLAGALGMNGPGDNLFAHSAFAKDQDGKISNRNLGDFASEFLNTPGRPDQPEMISGCHSV
jgi:hypothetical protein